MKRVVVLALGAVAAGGIVVAPAFAGLTGNPSFSQQIPVPVPSQARTLQADDSGDPPDGPGQLTPTSTPADDNGGSGSGS